MFASETERTQGVATGERLTGAGQGRELQPVVPVKAKADPARRFPAWTDKVWHEDVLAEAWGRVRRNGGPAGGDGETCADIGSQGVGRWRGEPGAGPEGRALPAEAGAVGSHPEETARQIPAPGPPVQKGPGGPDLDPAGA